MNRLFCVDDTKDVNVEERSAVHFITTEDEDRMGDIVRADGMDASAFQKNPVVLFAHNYGSMPIGKAMWLKPATRNGVKGVIAKTQFAPTPEGEQALQLWQQGFLNATSIGFLPKSESMTAREKGGWDIGSWDLLEYSIVPVPANAQALRLALNAGEVEVKSPQFVNSVILEARICELEECRAKMKEPVDLTPDIQGLREQIAALQAEIQALKTPPVETVARKPSQEEIMAAARRAVSGYFETHPILKGSQQWQKK
jgi:HK97 family phage prohead protease